MIRGKVCSVLKKHFTKYLSTASLPQTKNNLIEESISESKANEDVLQSQDYFQVHNMFTVKDLFEARVHYGHKMSLLEHNMKPFVFGSRLGHTIFDLDITAYHLREALNFAAHIAFREGIILFVSRNPRATLLVEDTAKSCGEYAVTREWKLGLLTDSTNKFGTVIRLPDLLIMLNTQEENGFPHQAVFEAGRMCIPTIGIVDSNCNPNFISYLVPGNDDSFSSVQLYCKLFKEAILRGKNAKKTLSDKVLVKTEHIEDRNVKTEHIKGRNVKTEHIEGRNVKTEHIDGRNVKTEHIEGRNVETVKENKRKKNLSKKIISDETNKKHDETIMKSNDETNKTKTYKKHPVKSE